MLNPSRLKAARKLRGWTITKLAQESGLSTKSLSSYENDHQDPEESTLRRLAEVLNVGTEFLTADDLDEIPLDSVSFRALSKMTARTRDRGLASARIALLLDSWISDRFDLPCHDVPSLTGRDPEIAAQEVRARWGLGEEAIRNVIHLLESHGVRVFSLTHDNLDLDAFCTTWHGQPYIFLGTNKSAERGRFNAAHELGHLVLHGEDAIPHGQISEDEANRFAASFLMPRSSVLAQGLRNAPADRLLHAKRKWGVAAMAMAHRANELGLMSEWSYRTACVDLSRMGYRRGEPGGLPRESSQLLSKVLQQLRSAGTGVRDIARDLGVEPDEVRAHMLGLTPTAVAGGSPMRGSSPRPTLTLHTNN
jgi:Zn-dependent peptidase ImmA (M78 family)/DNA-binding XRE family transcriptional regulator